MIVRAESNPGNRAGIAARDRRSGRSAKWPGGTEGIVGRTGGRMFYTDPSLNLQLLKLQEPEQAKRLELARLIRDAQASQPSLADRLLLRVSAALIATGER